MEPGLGGLRRRGRRRLRWIRRFVRRELAAFGRWIETTSNLIHLSVLLIVPLLIAFVTLLSNALAELSFLLFPPLASGTYTLFADPEGRYSDPVRFVGGLTLGSLSGWAALLAANLAYGAPTNAVGVHPEGAALSVLLTGVVTWVFAVEEASAFSTALLVRVTDGPRRARTSPAPCSSRPSSPSRS